MGAESFIEVFKQLKLSLPNTVIFLQMGDYYELVGRDAMIGRMVLSGNIRLRNVGDGYMLPVVRISLVDALAQARILVELGFLVAFVDQVKSKKYDGILEYVVSEKLTPTAGVINLETRFNGLYRSFMKSGEYRHLKNQHEHQRVKKQIENRAFKVANAKNGFDYEKALLALDLDKLTPKDAHRLLVDWKVQVLK